MLYRAAWQYTLGTRKDFDIVQRLALLVGRHLVVHHHHLRLQQVVDRQAVHLLGVHHLVVLPQLLLERLQVLLLLLLLSPYVRQQSGLHQYTLAPCLHFQSQASLILLLRLYD